MWLDAHNHLQDPRLPEPNDAMVAAWRDLGIDGAVVNGTSEDDWPQVADLADRFPDFIRPAFGLHPWKVPEARPGWEDRLRGYLLRFPRAHVGEIGLDRWVPGHDLPAQRAAFSIQWEMAATLDRAVTVHCLKAWDALFALWPDLPDRSGRVLIHGFNSAPEIAGRLVHLGCYLGFGGDALHPRKSSARAAFASLPEARLLLETDAPDMAGPSPTRTHFLDDPKLNHPANLDAIGRALADLRQLPPANLAAVLRVNLHSWLDGSPDAPDLDSVTIRGVA